MYNFLYACISDTLPLYIYLAAVSLFAVILTVRDKNAAIKQKRRIKERTLLIVSVLGGSVAMLITMLITHHKTKHLKFMVGIPVIIVLQVIIFIFALDTSLSVNHYTINTPKIDAPVKLALVADLHSCDYGKGQKKLINAVLNERPDIIFLVGDIFDDDLPPDNTIEFIEGIAGKAPCYYVSGNHEFWSSKADKFKDIILSYGIEVLEGTYADIELKGQKIRICGIDDPATNSYPSRAIRYADQLRNLKEAATTEAYTILLAHRPELIEEYLPLNMDLVLSAHAHGGQWRIPFVLEHGLFGPHQGWFPEYGNGVFLFDNTTMIISRGLAKESTPIPRIFNRPEIVIITLEPK